MGSLILMLTAQYKTCLQNKTIVIVLLVTYVRLTDYSMCNSIYFNTLLSKKRLFFIIFFLFSSLFISSCDGNHEKEMLYAFEVEGVHGYAPRTSGVIIFNDGSVKGYYSSGPIQSGEVLSKTELTTRMLAESGRSFLEQLITLPTEEIKLYQDTIEVVARTEIESIFCRRHESADILFYINYYHFNFDNGLYTPLQLDAQFQNVLPENKISEVSQGYKLIVNKLLEYGFLTQFKADCALTKS